MVADEDSDLYRARPQFHEYYSTVSSLGANSRHRDRTGSGTAASHSRRLSRARLSRMMRLVQVDRVIPDT